MFVHDHAITRYGKIKYLENTRYEHVLGWYNQGSCFSRTECSNAGISSCKPDTLQPAVI